MYANSIMINARYTLTGIESALMISKLESEIISPIEAEL
jgi:hypothetical protein